MDPTYTRRDDCKNSLFSLSCYSICRFQGVHDICFKSFAVPSHQRLLHAAASLTRGMLRAHRRKWLPHSPEDAARWQGGAWEHICCSRAHRTDVFHVPFQENYTTHVSYSFSPGYEFPWAQPFAPDVSIAHTRRKSRWNHRHLVLWHLTSPYFCHIEQFVCFAL